MSSLGLWSFVHALTKQASKHSLEVEYPPSTVFDFGQRSEDAQQLPLPQIPCSSGLQHQVPVMGAVFALELF